MMALRNGDGFRKCGPRFFAAKKRCGGTEAPPHRE